MFNILSNNHIFTVFKQWRRQYGYIYSRKIIGIIHFLSKNFWITGFLNPKNRKYSIIYNILILLNMSLFSCSVMSDSLWSHGLQHTRLPCPSLSLTVCSNSYPLSQWCHPTISCSVVPFSPQSFPASGSLPMSWLFLSVGQRIRASAPVLPMNI